MAKPDILIVGAADTGRAPMAAAMLRRLLGEQGLPWDVASTGIVGHDGYSAEPEARSAMMILGFDLEAHRARSLTPELVVQAQVLLAIDSGIARVVRMRFPDAVTVSLGELAGRARDIPDPFRMQVGAWVQYGNEIVMLLRAGMMRLCQLVDPALSSDTGAGSSLEPAAAPSGEASEPDPSRLDLEVRGVALPATALSMALPHERREPLPPMEQATLLVQRAERILLLIAEVPDVIIWAAARHHLLADLGELEQTAPLDGFGRAYLALVRAMLVLANALPTPDQAHLLLKAFARLAAPLTATDVTAASAMLGHFQ
ncbi:low molecular weight phosphatase family protein [Candidatus Chloroploca sp. Khr17]|uniref:arsenate reductase/protein-tyrosine-phosphatase family protein n=1 Tax=Candidatus Chloroploca sp. Khr17 TaxID=2496869 RepID=UPI001F0ECD71|nr:low molecular weight phosphatase family protein [Candidatus Chloroploca sp. Khr17]